MEVIEENGEEQLAEVEDFIDRIREQMDRIGEE